MPASNLTTHSARKTHIDNLAQSYFSSPHFHSQSQLISRFLTQTHTPTFSNPHPKTLERSPSWRTCWSTVTYQDDQDGRWWASVPVSDLPVEIQSIGLNALRELRTVLASDFKGTECGVHTEQVHNPFSKPMDDTSWSLLKHTRDKRPIEPEVEGWTYRLKVILRWTDGSWVRFRQRTVWTSFWVQPSSPALRKNVMEQCWVGKEIEHLEYAEIEYHHDRELQRVGSSRSEMTLIGHEEEEKMSDQEVKEWAAGFGNVKRKKRLFV